MTSQESSRNTTVVSALVLALGASIAAWALGAQIKETRLGDRYVTVKGLVERKVKSDLAVWSLNYKEAGDDLTSVSAKTESNKQAILQFLSQQGLQSSE